MPKYFIISKTNDEVNFNIFLISFYSLKYHLKVLNQYYLQNKQKIIPQRLVENSYRKYLVIQIYSNWIYSK